MDESDIRRLDEIRITSEEEWFDAPEEEHDQTETSIQQSYVTVLKEEDIRKRMKNVVQRVSDIYSISESEATLLLTHFRWDVIEFNKKWFDNAESVRKSVGLFELDTPLDSPSDDKKFYCGICFKLLSLEKSASVSCGHRVCKFCWTSRINKSINEIPDVDWHWTLKCPFCPASVGGDMIERFASDKEKTKYYRYLFRSYVDGSKVIKCCPAKGRSCDVHHTPGSGNFDVLCLCLLSFCWNCSKDTHSPMDCESAANWLEMNSSDYQNPNWVRENTVPCPRCKLRIRENQDWSLKMKCLPPCNYDFCWRCRGEWTGHGGETGLDLYTCTHDEFEETVLGNTAEAAADRYRACHEMWMSNESLMQNTKAKVQQLHTDLIPDLSNKQLATVQQLQFIVEAWSQIMECRRVLKWSCAYEYYLREDEVEKQAFLKLKQDHAEIPLQKLYNYAEDQLNTLLESDGPSENFNKFRSDLTNSTRITRNHYELLVRDLEDGLSNVVPASTLQGAHNEDDASGSSSIHDD